MLYCDRCHTLYDDCCPLCQRHDGRVPMDDDAVFVTEQNNLWSGVLLDVFQQANVPLLRRQAVGVAACVGANLSRYRLYTLFSHYEEAMALCAEVLEPAEDLAAEDGESPVDGEGPDTFDEV